MPNAEMSIMVVICLPSGTSIMSAAGADEQISMTLATLEPLSACHPSNCHCVRRPEAVWPVWVSWGGQGVKGPATSEGTHMPVN